MVVVPPERDHGEGHHDPGRRGEEPEGAARDPGREAVDRPERERPEHEHVEEDDRRHRVDEARAGHGHDRRDRERPAVAGVRRRQVALTEQPAGRQQPDLVAALVEEPAVVAHGQRVDEDREPLDDGEHGQRHERPRDGKRDALLDPHPAAPAVLGQRRPQLLRGVRRLHAPRVATDTRRRCARAPSRSGVVAWQPKSSRARLASRPRRGWPFGIEVSHTISPSKPVTSATSSARSRIEISSPVPRLTGSRAVVALGGESERLDAVVDVEELARRRAVAPEHDLVATVEHLPDQVRDHVRVRRVEVVARPVEVRRQQIDGAEPVLVAVGLRAVEHGLLGDAVRRVRLLREAVPELVLDERHRRELRIGADRADERRACRPRADATARARARPSSGSRTSSGPGSPGSRRSRPPRPRGGRRAPAAHPRRGAPSRPARVRS